jgi:hypothetical protein
VCQEGTANFIYDAVVLYQHATVLHTNTLQLCLTGAAAVSAASLPPTPFLLLHLQVTTAAEAAAAFREAAQLSDHFIFIEVIVDKRDAAPASAALRQGFMARHFSPISGYKHLNLGASLAADSSLTAAAAAAGGGSGHDGCASVGAAAAAGEGAGGGAGGNGGVTSGMREHVSTGPGPAAGLHPFAGSSTCLVAEGEGEVGRMSPAGGLSPGAGAVVEEGNRQRGSSRLGLVPAKRAAEGDPERSV